MKDRKFLTKDKDGKDVELCFKRPTQAQINKAELAYRVSFSKAFAAGVLTSAQANEQLRKRGIWTEEQEEFGNNLRVEILSCQTLLTEGNLSLEEGRKVYDKIKEKRQELDIHNSLYTTVADNTCEALAAEYRNHFFCAECTVYSDTGKKVYKDVDELKDRADELMSIVAYKEAVIASLEVVMGKDLSSDLESEYPENKWLEDKEAADLKEQEKEEDSTKVAAKPKKKRGRKKVVKAS